MPRPAAIIAPIVIGQKYFFTIAFARSWKKYNSVAIIAKRPVRNIADTPTNIHNGYPMNPSHIANSLYGIGVTAVKTIINMPYLLNIGLMAVSINSGFVNVFIIHMPSESHNHAPIRYAIMPPTIEPSAAAIVIGNARFLFAMIGGVINTSGGINKNIDSQIVKKNTIHEYARLSDLLNIYSANFIYLSVPMVDSKKFT